MQSLKNSNTIMHIARMYVAWQNISKVICCYDTGYIQIRSQTVRLTFWPYICQCIHGFIQAKGNKAKMAKFIFTPILL